MGRPKAKKTISFKFLEIIAVRKRPLTGIGKTCILPEDLRGCSIGGCREKASSKDTEEMGECP